jgi:hypothetical protein
MSKRDEKIAQYTAEAKKLGLELSADLITKVTLGLGLLTPDAFGHFAD